LATGLSWFFPEPLTLLLLTLVYLLVGLLGQSPIRAYLSPLVTYTRPLPPPLESPPWLQAWARAFFGGELLLLTALGFSMTGAFHADEPGRFLNGAEAEWLTQSGYFAAQSLRDYGYIPLWQPHILYGEPLIHSPFSFVANPFSTLPALLLGGTAGLKWSVVLHVLLAGWGGWVLGRVMGLGPLGRVMLGLLMMSKGNMLAMIGVGYFQLGLTQAYFPWIIAGALAILQPPSTTAPPPRWPPVLLALSFTLMFWAGNIWYSLPMLICLAVLAAFYLPRWRPLGLAWGPLRRLIWAGLLTIGFSAFTLIPIWAHQDLIGGHPDDLSGGRVADRELVLRQFYDGSPETYAEGQAPGLPEFYYSYVAPLWFFGLLFVLIPPLPAWTAANRVPGPWRLIGAAALLFALHFLWGVGGNRAIIWAYQNLILLAQWRFVGRALAVASFWVAVLLAWRIDSLWQMLLSPVWLQRLRPLHPLAVRALQGTALGGLVLACYLAAGPMRANWQTWAGTAEYSTHDAQCLDWILAHSPDRPLSVYRMNYNVIQAFLEREVRKTNLEADFFLLPQADTLPAPRYFGSRAPYAIAWSADERAALREWGYVQLTDSPRPFDEPCAWLNPQAWPYAFGLKSRYLASDEDLIRELVTPLSPLSRLPDSITLQLPALPEEQVLVIQELAYPGWRVWVDGRPAHLEVMGGWAAVKVGPGDIDRAYEVRFAYRPGLVYQSAGISLFSFLRAILYLSKIRLRGNPT
jgi:hypothetical protein